MKINEQLFEDVLSGKLNGKFMLRNGSTLDSKCLKRTVNTSLQNNSAYPYALITDTFASSYTEKGKWNMNMTFCVDIIDFIPDTNMKENELTIEIPDDKVVDWNESKKQNKIVLKDK